MIVTNDPCPLIDAHPHALVVRYGEAHIAACEAEIDKLVASNG
jgi:hypothetical protein